MAANLLKHGNNVIVHDLNTSAVKELVNKGAKEATSPRDVASRVNSFIVTMLPSSPHVRSVYLDTNSGLLSAIQANTVLIDASTIDPGVARSVAAQAAEKKVAMLDAPVSGGVGGAEAGTLTFMVGGSAPDFERAKPLLQMMGKNIVHCGNSGNGQVAKICNNMVLAISMIGVSEAMNLGLSLGIDAKVLAGIFNTSSARCWSSDTYNPVPGVMSGVPSSRGYTGGFAVELMTKDVGLAVNAAHDTKAALPLGSQALQLYTLLCSQGYGKKDFSSVFEYLNSKK